MINIITNSSEYNIISPQCLHCHYYITITVVIVTILILMIIYYTFEKFRFLAISAKNTKFKTPFHKFEFKPSLAE